MSGKYGRNEWKIKLFYLLCAIVILLVAVGAIGGAYKVIKPKYMAYKEEKEKEKLEEEREKLAAEQKRAEEEKKAAEEEAKQEAEEKAKQEAEEEAKQEAAEKAKKEEEEKAKQEAEEKAKEEEEKKKNKANSDYIIANSDSKYLTDSDIKGMSLKDLNYAKNEIYARRGRKFQSKELQDYFNSKSWYKGTIEPDAFQENMLNEYEKKNAAFLSNAEYSKDPNGYSLDQ